MEPINIIDRTSILWASLRFFTVVTRNEVAFKGGSSRSNGKTLFDHGQKPPRVKHDEQLVGQLTDRIDQVEAIYAHPGLLIRLVERLDAVRVNSLNIADLV